MKYLLAVALALAVVLAACTLKAPLGDPASSRIDHRLDGVWLAETGRTDRYATCLVAPIDDHTYVIVCSEFKNDQGLIGSAQGTGVLRGWLTDVGGDTFLTVQPVAHLVPDSDVKKSYFATKVSFDASGGLQCQFLNDDFKDLGSITDPAALERMVTANLREPDLFRKPQSYRRCRMDDAFEKKLQAHVLDGWK